MEVNIEIKSGKKWVKRAAWSTMGKHGEPKSELTIETFQSLLIGRHSPIEEYEIWVDAIVPERVHTHVVRHKELGKYIATSRPDISYMRKLEDGERYISLRFNAKRLIEIMMLRKCNRSWHETRRLFFKIEHELVKLEPAFRPFLVPSCVWYGFCNETHPDNECDYMKTPRYTSERKNLVSLGR